MMSAGIQAYGLGVFVTPMTAELGWSRTEISLGQTLSTAVSGVIGLFLGGLLDRRGGRALTVWGALLAGVGFILLGQVHTLWQYYAVKAGVLTLGMAGMGGMVANVVVSNWFVRRRGRAIAITAMGTSFAAIIVPSLAAQMIDAFGWRTAWAVLGVAVWVFVIPPAALIMRRRPEDHGLVPDGSYVAPRAGDRLAAQRAAVDGVRWTRRQAMRTPALWMLILTFGLGSMGFGAMLLHLIPFLTDSGYSRVEAAGAFSMLGVSGLISKPVWGIIADRIPSRFAAAAEFALLGVGVFFISIAPTLPLMYAAIFTMGVGVGGVITLQETVWADYFGRITLGTVRSVGRPFTIVSSAGGPVLAGLAYDLNNSYQVAFMVFIALRSRSLILLTPTPRAPGRAQARPAASRCRLPALFAPGEPTTARSRRPAMAPSGYARNEVRAGPRLHAPSRARPARLHAPSASAVAPARALDCARRYAGACYRNGRRVPPALSRCKGPDIQKPVLQTAPCGPTCGGGAALVIGAAAVVVRRRHAQCEHRRSPSDLERRASSGCTGKDGVWSRMVIAYACTTGTLTTAASSTRRVASRWRSRSAQAGDPRLRRRRARTEGRRVPDGTHGGEGRLRRSRHGLVRELPIARPGGREGRDRLRTEPLAGLTVREVTTGIVRVDANHELPARPHLRRGAGCDRLRLD
jgi:MFS family permease